MSSEFHRERLVFQFFRQLPRRLKRFLVREMIMGPSKWIVASSSCALPLQCPSLSDPTQILQWYLPPFFSYTDHAQLQLSSNLVVVLPHRGAVDAQISGNSGLVGYIRVLPQIGGDGLFFLGLTPSGYSVLAPERRAAISAFISRISTFSFSSHSSSE